MNHYRHHTGLLARSARSLVSTRILPAASITGTSAFHTSIPRESRSSQKNHYESLGLTKDATKKDIKAQFYKLSKMHHPDKNSSEESRKAFLSINEAYSVLGNERQRRDYDLTLLDKSGSLYSNSSSQRSAPTRGTLRRTPFRHSAQSAAAAAAARTHAAFRPQYGFRQSVSHFDSKSHQEMHYKQELRQEERRQARMRSAAEYQEQQAFDESDTWTSKFLRASLVLVMVMLSTSLMKAFAEEDNDEERHDCHPQSHRVLCSMDSDRIEGSSRPSSEGAIFSALHSRHST
ncbi:MAG: hypothetical protein J3Q66DRAFT_353368 [Benniella sp.]|nr:MAG: hypothetical protein J3Q66DRAFT_353368 [Benniella sp.]